jgi:hypothetical protein
MLRKAPPLAVRDVIRAIQHELSDPREGPTPSAQGRTTPSEPHGAGAFSEGTDRSLLWRVVKRSQSRLARYPFFYGLLYRVAVRYKRYVPKRRRAR